MALSRSPEDLCSRIRDLIAIVARLQVILTALEQEELTFRGQSDIEEFVSLFQERNNHTPKHINRGYTPRGGSSIYLSKQIPEAPRSFDRQLSLFDEILPPT